MTFRPVEFWQAALMTLPNNTFFDLMRSVLGTVKTPYNKQNLIDDLSRFLIRPEIQETIGAYIDDNDRKLIAAIALLAEPLPGELESFFTGEFSYADLQSILLNLEERLIIYRFRDKANLRIALNPRLENVLGPYASNTDILFAPVPMNKKSKKEEVTKEESGDAGDVGAEQIQSAALDERTMAAFLSYIVNSNAQVKEDISGREMSFVFRKKTAALGKQLFPGIDINTIAGGFLNIGLIVQEGDGILPDESRISAFKELSDNERIEYLAAGIAFFMYRNCVSVTWQSRGMLFNTVKLIHAIANIIKDGNGLPESTMIKLIELFRRQEEQNWEFSGGVPPAALLLNSLVMAGFFTTKIIDGITFFLLTPRPGAGAAEKSGGKSSKKAAPLIAMDSSFSCVLYPGISFTDAIDLAAFCTVEETGTTVRFSLSRDSVVKSFDRMYTAESIYELLDRLSGGRIPETLQWNLNDWEKRWKEVSLNQGVILTLSAEREYLAGTQPLNSMIAKKLAPGIYLLSTSIEEAESALLVAGVDIVSRPCVRSARSSSFFVPLGKPETYVIPKGHLSSKEDALKEKEASIKNAEAIKNNFRAVLEKMKLSKQEQEEMESRIERRVVVNETQLKDTSLRYERLEARSLDYVGKTGIVRQAISSGSLLEVSCLNGDKILGTPESLEKKGTEMILTIRARTGGEPQKINLGKISLIRRIKQSIFGA
jgi:hypothetical protein